MTRCVITYTRANSNIVHILCLIKLTMIATQELVVPKSIPITSPASLELIHLLFVCCNWEERPTPIVDCIIDVLVVALVANDIEDRRPNWSAMIALFVLLAWLISIPRKMMLLILHYSEPNGVDYFMREHGAVIIEDLFTVLRFAAHFSLLGFCGWQLGGKASIRIVS